MHKDIVNEVLRFFTRQGLDALQIVSRYFDETIANSTTLPLRYIQFAFLAECRTGLYIEARMADDSETAHINYHKLDHHSIEKKQLLTEQGRHDVLYRLSNAYIRCLHMCMACGTFHRYMREHADVLRYSVVNKLQLRCANYDAVAIDHEAVRAVMAALRPQVYAPDVDKGALHDDYMLLFDQACMRGSIPHLELRFHTGFSIPASLIQPLLNVSALSTCEITAEGDPTPWINEFVQAFEQADAGAIPIESLTILQRGQNLRVLQALPPAQHHLSALLRPLKTDVPAPTSRFVKYFMDAYKCEATLSTAKLYAFENARIRKRLEVYAFAICTDEIDPLYKVVHFNVMDA